MFKSGEKMERERERGSEREREKGEKIGKAPSRCYLPGTTERLRESRRVK